MQRPTGTRAQGEAYREIDLSAIRAEAAARLGDVLTALGSHQVIGSNDRGRAACPAHDGHTPNLAYSNGKLFCHYCARGWDALGLIAEVQHLNLSSREGLGEAAEFLAGVLAMPVYGSPSPRPRPVPKPQPVPSRDASRLWSELATRDADGERYLASRGLQASPDLVRFVRHTSDEHLNSRARQGYRVAFPVRRPDGSVQSVSLRFLGNPLDGLQKTVALAGCPVTGGAICRPEIALLATGEPEFALDEIIVCEGGPDVLAADAALATSHAEDRTPPCWPIGAVGVSAVPGMLRAFASVIRGRRVHLALDGDEKGEAAIPAAAEAAWQTGAREVTRMRPPAGKDIAEGLTA